MISFRLYVFSHYQSDHFVGLVVKAPALRTTDLRFSYLLHHGDFSGLSQTNDLKIGTPVASLPGTWRCGAGWPGFSIL